MVAVTNYQNSEITLSNSEFELIAPDGTQYASSVKSMEVGERNSLFLAGLNPGLTKEGVVIFDIPESVEASGLQLRFHGGMTGDSEVLPLTVQAAPQHRHPRGLRNLRRWMKPRLRLRSRLQTHPLPVRLLLNNNRPRIRNWKQHLHPIKTPMRKSATKLLPVLLSSTSIGRHGTSCFDNIKHRWYLRHH
jgi:Domain of unknown function (DUF4352)